MNNRVLTTGLAAACLVTAFAPSASAQDIAAQPINLIINKAPKNGTIPDPDPIIIGEFGYNMIFTAKISATVRKIFYKPVRHRASFGIDRFIDPALTGTKKFPLKASKVVKGEIDNYVYEEENNSDAIGVAFFHEKGNGIYRAGSTTKASKILFLKKTDTDKTGVDPEKMASCLSILDWTGKFSTSSSKAFQFPYLLFAAPSPKGKELWLSDGSAAGTKLFADINPTTTDTPGPRGKTIKVPNSSAIQPISTYAGNETPAYGHQAYFSAYNGSTYDVYHVTSHPDAVGKQPKVTYEALVQRLFANATPLPFNQPLSLCATDDGVFFTLIGATGQRELWGYDSQHDVIDIFSDGAGTLQPTEFEFTSGKPFGIGTAHGYLFSGIAGANGREPLQAEFSLASSEIFSLGNIAANGANSNPHDFTSAGEYIFFVANPGDGDHLYNANGTPSGTYDMGRFDNIHEITPVIDLGSDSRASGDDVYFVANDNGTPTLWKVPKDGTTNPVKVVTTGNHPVRNPTHLKRLVGNGCWYLFFSCDGVGTEYENITPAKGSPFPAQHQVWYTGTDDGIYN